MTRKEQRELEMTQEQRDRRDAVRSRRLSDAHRQFDKIPRIAAAKRTATGRTVRDTFTRDLKAREGYGIARSMAGYTLVKISPNRKRVMMKVGTGYVRVPQGVVLLPVKLGTTQSLAEMFLGQQTFSSAEGLHKALDSH
jgi:hypothetical protein